MVSLASDFFVRTRRPEFQALGGASFISNRVLERSWGNSATHRMNGILLMKGLGCGAARASTASGSSTSPGTSSISWASGSPRTSTADRPRALRARHARRRPPEADAGLRDQVIRSREDALRRRDRADEGEPEEARLRRLTRAIAHPPRPAKVEEQRLHLFREHRGIRTASGGSRCFRSGRHRTPRPRR